MKVCEDRKLVNATLHDAVDFICDDCQYGGVAEAINIFGEIFSPSGQGSVHNSDLWCLDIVHHLTPKGKDFLYRLANWCLWEFRGTQRMDGFTQQYPQQED